MTELNQYQPIFTVWATSEPELGDILLNIGAAIERNSAAQSAVVHSYTTTIGNPIKDYLAYIEIVQETLKKREAYQYTYESSIDELNKRHNEKDKV